MWETLFLQVLNMSVTGGMVILFVLITRLLLKKAPKIFSYALWSVVLFRLVCPFSFESVFSVFSITCRDTNDIRPFPTEIKRVTPPETVIQYPNSTVVMTPLERPPFELIFTVIWLVGIAALLIYSVVSLLKLRRRLKDAVQESGNIYSSASLTSPFVMGLFRPKIYLPAHLAEEEKRYILLHEQTHIKRLDHVVKIVSFFVLCLHWFNPLVWVAFFLSGRDMELSCDEAVIKRLGSDVKKDYSSSLLSLATGRRIVGGTPLAFGEGDTKSRIKNVLNYKKPAFWVIVVTTIAVVAIGVGLMANPKGKSAELDAAQALWDARTEYVGNNAAVGQLLGLLEFPDSLTYQFFTLQTDGDERGVALSLIQDTIRPLTDLETWQLNKNALLLFALIGNLEDVRCSLEDGNGGSVALHQTRAWADKMVEGDIRDYGESAEKLQELLQLAAAAAPAEYTMVKLGKNGEVLAESTPENQALAQKIVMDGMVKSAAWEGVDVSTLEECYLIRQSFAEAGETHDYYAYRLKEATAALPSDTAVLQSGADGRYSVLSTELYTQLVDSFDALSTVIPYNVSNETGGKKVAQKLQLQRRLETAIAAIDGVKSCSVVIADALDGNKSSVTVTLKMEEKQELNDKVKAGIKTLVENSIDDLSENDITIHIL